MDTFKKIFKYPIREDNSIKLFLTQSAAIEYSRNRASERLTTFSFEVSNFGQRQFLVANITDFIKFYTTQPVKNMYEVIEEGKSCKLFFDIEYSKTLNPYKDGSSMVKRLIEIVIDYLNRDYGVQVSDTECLWLEASNSKKFSVHLIFFTVTFNTITDCGRFVQEMLTQMKTDDIKNFDVQAASGRQNVPVQKSFVDQGIYTRNRQLRILLSSKFKQDRPLVLSTSDVSSSNITRDRDSFLQVVLRRSFITVPEEDNCHAIAPKKSTVSKIRQNGLNLSSVISSNISNEDSETAEVDSLISNLVAPGRIRKKTVFADGTVCYNISGAHYCQIKQANHHSKGQIFFVYNPREASLIQKCFSENCKHLPGVPIEIR